MNSALSCMSIVSLDTQFCNAAIADIESGWKVAKFLISNVSLHITVKYSIQLFSDRSTKRIIVDLLLINVL